MAPKSTAHDSESSGSASTLTGMEDGLYKPEGWVLRVNKHLGDSLADSHSERETLHSGPAGESGQSVQSGYSVECGQSGQSASDEERLVSDSHQPRSSEATSADSRAVFPAVPHPKRRESPVRDPRSSNEPEDHRNEPCLFHSYAGCLKGARCEYSHLIHADQIQAPGPKTRKGHARHSRLRIKRCLGHQLNTPDLYSVHHELQKEARKDYYAKDLIRKHLRRAIQHF